MSVRQNTCISVRLYVAAGTVALYNSANNKVGLNVKKKTQNTFRKILCLIMWISHQQQGIAQLPYRSVTRIDSHLPLCVVTPCPATTYISEAWHDVHFNSRKGSLGGCNVTKLFLSHVIFFITKHYQGFVSNFVIPLNPPNLLMCYWWNSGSDLILDIFWAPRNHQVKQLFKSQQDNNNISKFCCVHSHLIQKHIFP